MAVCLVRSECIPKGQKPCLYRFPDASYTLLQKIADPHPHEEAKAVPHHGTAFFRVSSQPSGPGLKSDDVEDAQHQATELRPDATRSIFVSPSGSDAGDGSAQHPLRSLRAAQTAARSAAAAGAQAQVLLTAGAHRLESQPAVLLEAADSGRPGSSTVYSGQPGAAALVSGGRQLSQWERAGSPWPGASASAPIWRADVSALRNTTAWPFHTLRVGHESWPMARWPRASSQRPWAFLGNWSCDAIGVHPCNKAPLKASAGTGRIEDSFPVSLGLQPSDLPPGWPASLDGANIRLFGSFERDVISQLIPIPSGAWNLSDRARPIVDTECFGCAHSLCVDDP